MITDLWVNKHYPKSLYDMKGLGDHIKKALGHVNSYATPVPTRKILLLYGPPGCGKTTMATLIANACNIGSIKINCSSNRSLDSITGAMSQYLFSTPQDESKILIILDESDGQDYDSKVYEYLEKALQYAVNPIIATCNNTRAIPMDFLKERCIDIKFKRPGDATIRNQLYEIATKENCKLTVDQYDKLIIKGDMRASIFTLQIYCMSGYTPPANMLIRDRNIFTETQSCLNKPTEISHKVKPEDLIHWIEENGFDLFAGIDKYHFYNTLSEVSNMLGSYKTKQANLLLGNISLAKSYPESDRYIDIKKSAYMSHFSMTKHIRSQINSLSRKLAPYYSCSSQDFFDYIFPIIQRQASSNNNYAKEIYLKYQLTKEELALILDCTLKDPRINKISKIDQAILKASSPTPQPTAPQPNTLLDIFQ